MGVRITGNPGEGAYAALYDSVSMLAFGPVCSDPGEAEAFLEWLDAEGHEDPRVIPVKELDNLHTEFRKATGRIDE